MNVSIINDESIEGNETFTIYLTSDVGSTYIETEVTIIDDDYDDGNDYEGTRTQLASDKLCIYMYICLTHVKLMLLHVLIEVPVHNIALGHVYITLITSLIKCKSAVLVTYTPLHISLCGFSVSQWISTGKAGAFGWGGGGGANLVVTQPTCTYSW